MPVLVTVMPIGGRSAAPRMGVNRGMGGALSALIGSRVQAAQPTATSWVRRVGFGLVPVLPRCPGLGRTTRSFPLLLSMAGSRSARYAYALALAMGLMTVWCIRQSGLPCSGIT